MCNVVTFVLIASNTHHNQIYYSFRWIELSYQLPLKSFNHKTEEISLLQYIGRSTMFSLLVKLPTLVNNKKMLNFNFSFIDFIVLCIYDFLSIKTGTINQERQLKTTYWEKCKFLVNVWFGVNWIMKPEINYFCEWRGNKILLFFSKLSF